ncbi:hypothetical protein [Candidatus Vondammii sp. HM_W22]|uniref:hypothetical protein n=1 Tax=Candidatus Vondammii sp. HM_W22 TaxID=2687299 RepID=UPI001F13ABD7|nr:hypothetical protein [Candidatus Vondammii sp. HM_W22]
MAISQTDPQSGQLLKQTTLPAWPFHYHQLQTLALGRTIRDIQPVLVNKLHQRSTIQQT